MSSLWSNIDLEKSNAHIQPSRPVKRLLTPILTKKIPPIPQESERTSYPFYRTNILSKAFCTWLLPLLSKGYKRTLQQEDLWKLDEHTSIDYVYTNFEKHLNDEMSKFDSKHQDDEESFPRFAIFLALVKTFKYEYSIAIITKFISNALNAFAPLISKRLINFISEKALYPDTPINKGVGYSIGLTFMLMFSAIFMNQSLLHSKLVGGHSKTLLTKTLIQKSLVSNSETKFHYPSGRIISFMSADLQRIDQSIYELPTGLTIIEPIIIAIILLLINIGVSALAGIAVFFLTLTVMAIPAISLFKIRKRANVFTDERINKMREVIQSLKMIKFYSWEDAYEEMITNIRSKESSLVLKFQFIVNLVITIAINSSSITAMGAFLVLYAVDSQGNPATVFSSLTLFGILSTQIIELPMVFSSAAEGLLGLSRVTKFLRSPEETFDLENYYNDELIKDEKTSILIENGNFEWPLFNEKSQDEKPNKKLKKSNSWFSKKKVETTVEEVIESDDSTIGKESKNFKLSNINLKISKGEFIVITGPTGSGKSSLLSAISALMNKTHGEIGINGSNLLCGSPWIQNTTIRENIIFGSKFDREKYDEILKVCSLKHDLQNLSAGDLTEIGERGVTLSGGQKSRVNLARAIYADKDIYLFDDILSAVDANVGKHITENCLLGYIKDKTRIITTHQLSLINKADRIVFLNGDGTVDIGTESELRSQNKEFVQLMVFNEDSRIEIENKDQIDYKTQNQTEKNVTTSHEKPLESDGTLIKAEERAVDSIPLSLYKQYIHAGQGIFGYSAVPLTLIFVIFAVFTKLFVNVWLSFWVSYKFKNLTNGEYIAIYVMITALSVIFVSIELSIMGYVFTESSKNLNLKAMKKVLHSPMSFIDTTPVGRIINRFSKDTNSLDNEIGMQLKLFVYYSSSIIGILIMCIIYLPWFAIAVPFLIIFFLCITNFYQASSREVKRLEAINRSFVYNNFNEVMNGMNTIKSYGAQSRFIAKNDLLNDHLNEVYFVVVANQRWIAVSLDIMATGIVLIVTMLSLTGQFNINASSVGLLTYYMIELSRMLSTLMQTYSEVENDMNSVERVCQYANNLEQEAAYKKLDYQPRPTWPEEGSIEFKDLSLKYRDDLPLVLKKLSISIKGGEKIGICGRTGAGKSSLMVALYRIAESFEGQVLIDGIDISKLGLYDLRSKLSIIPQDPVLFQGTIRSNLDPFNNNTDEELWDALKRSGLAGREDDKFHLESIVEDEGANFSLGERQLLALARALVRRTKILIMDEATSSVDYKTDSFVQETITREFSDCTILCIAHRLKTIINYDKILVLEKGELEEFDKPLELFQRQGVFRDMCIASNIGADDF
ncbi:Multidrug resistance-associated protein 1 [Wickerhamomyces ciferrii]|uniref:Multidrug resistance-associated protein 1 n=1 Tax=Wickerhamomyces ciferrii (strain ATCC 14091 / BCRC 22168 / CBS 111 / JCM 3599 / NBRC 0793 / NRRL Y-1031 F-60-10) TaxID=1206466 RepID=K0KXP5_WICCF|nr:Multidrug resistance-associated protein 1 [Wickerhamomyces ciferrii]CCH46807.1 Multidrug resistance-associated protein 1 [Wickerhamomyces ciferrii]